MQEITLNNKDLLIMNLVHYFVTEKNYNPIILHGIEDEVWLENMNGDYRVVRIVGHYIHNNEQLKYDKFNRCYGYWTFNRGTFTIFILWW